MIVRELVTKLGFKTDKAALSTFEKNVNNAKSAVVALTVAITSAVTATLLFVESAAKAGDRLDKLRDIIGFTTKDYQLLEGAASLAGIENDSLSKSLQLFARSIGMARQGMSEQIKQFAILGINMRDSNGQLKSNKELLLEVADAFQNKLTNNVDRAAVAQLLFGRSGLRMINFLEKGRKGILESSKEFGKYAFILDKKAIKQSQVFTDRQFLLSSAFKSLKNEIGVGMMPVLTKLINQTLKWIATNKKLITSTLLAFFKTMIFLAKQLGNILGLLVGVVKDAVDIWNHLNDAFGVTVKILTGLFALQIMAKLKLFKNLITGGLGLVEFIFSPIGLITAAIVSLLLVLDDLAVYLTGGKSVIGVIFKKFPMLKKVIEGMFKGIKILIDTMIVGPLNTVKALVMFIIHAVEALIKKSHGFTGKLFGGGPGLSGFTEKSGLTKPNAKATTIMKLIGSGVSAAAAGARNITANTSTAAITKSVGSGASAVAAGARNVNFNTSIALTVPAGTSEMQQSFIRNSAEKSFEPILRRKLRDALSVFPEVEQ